MRVAHSTQRSRMRNERSAVLDTDRSLRRTKSMEVPAIPFAYIAFDKSVQETGDISNMSAEQYLSWVRYQADSLPSVTRSAIDPSSYSVRQTAYMPAIDSIPDCPVEFLPHDKWEADIMFSFSDLRSVLEEAEESGRYKDRIVAVPQLKDAATWCQFCFGEKHRDESSSSQTYQNDDPPINGEQEMKRRKLEVYSMLELVDDGWMNEEGEEEGHEDNTVPISWEGASDVTPTIRLLLQFDQVLTQRLLTFHVDWLVESRPLTEKRCLWLYALLARLEKPLDQDMSSLLRKLFRVCSIKRASLKVGEVSAEVGTVEDHLSRLNTLICISGGYFRQGENYVCELNEDDEDDEDEETDEEEYAPPGLVDCTDREGENAVDAHMLLPFVTAGQFRDRGDLNLEDGECADD